MTHMQFKMCLGLKGCEVYVNDDVEPSFLVKFKKFIGFKCIILNKDGEVLGESFRLWNKLWKQTFRLEVGGKRYIFELGLNAVKLLSEEGEVLLTTKRFDSDLYTQEGVLVVKGAPQKIKFLGRSPWFFETNTTVDPIALYLMCGMRRIYDSMCG